MRLSRKLDTNASTCGFAVGSVIDALPPVHGSQMHMRVAYRKRRCARPCWNSYLSRREALQVVIMTMCRRASAAGSANLYFPFPTNLYLEFLHRFCSRADGLRLHAVDRLRTVRRAEYVGKQGSQPERHRCGFIVHSLGKPPIPHVLPINICYNCKLPAYVHM